MDLRLLSAAGITAILGVVISLMATYFIKRIERKHGNDNITLSMEIISKYLEDSGKLTNPQEQLVERTVFVEDLNRQAQEAEKIASLNKKLVEDLNRQAQEAERIASLNKELIENLNRQAQEAERIASLLNKEQVK